MSYFANLKTKNSAFNFPTLIPPVFVPFVQNFMRLQGTTVSGALCTAFLVPVVYNTLKNSALCHKMEIKCVKKYISPGIKN